MPPADGRTPPGHRPRSALESPPFPERTAMPRGHGRLSFILATRWGEDEQAFHFPVPGDHPGPRAPADGLAGRRGRDPLPERCARCLPVHRAGGRPGPAAGAHASVQPGRPVLHGLRPARHARGLRPPCQGRPRLRDGPGHRRPRQLGAPARGQRDPRRHEARVLRHAGRKAHRQNPSGQRAVAEGFPAQRIRAAQRRAFGDVPGHGRGPLSPAAARTPPRRAPRPSTSPRSTKPGSGSSSRSTRTRRYSSWSTRSSGPRSSIRGRWRRTSSR